MADSGCACGPYAPCPKHDSIADLDTGELARPGEPGECGWTCQYSEAGHETYELDHKFMARADTGELARLRTALIGLRGAVIVAKGEIPARLGPPILPASFFHALGDVNIWLDKADAALVQHTKEEAR